MGTEQAPPPRQALKCPNGHTRWQIRAAWFYCGSCVNGGYEENGRFRELWDQRTGTYVDHGTFVRRWGTEPYR